MRYRGARTTQAKDDTMYTRSAISSAARAVGVALTLWLSACGGGDSGPATSAAGLYRGSGGAGRAFEVLVLDSGRYYAIYGLTSASASPVAGVMVGDGATSGTAFDSGNLHDFSIESHTLATATLASTIAPATSINATLTYSGGQSATFNAAFDAGFNQSPSVSMLAGTYVGEIAGLSKTEASGFTLDSSGVMAGSTLAGCSYVAIVLPHAHGNVYDISATFHTGCVEDGKTLKGHAFVSAGVLYAVVVNADLSSSVVFAALKS
jgi:hypothetical protein